MNKLALIAALLAGLTSVASASQRNQDPDFVFGTGGFANAEKADKTGATTDQGAIILDDTTATSGNSAMDVQLKNMDEQSQSNRK